ncbi:DUF202 domain-containing protein [Vibrio hannami]|uniref:DUF202 domain-containing protein n=1 Tax=Vibrio hannami TaxID=2717094 RepID=UPI003BB17C0B
MNSNQRDPGLQPERTSLSWLRTLLVLFAVALLLFRVSEYHNIATLLKVNACLIISYIAYFLIYGKARFSNFMSNKETVVRKDISVKKALSLIMSVTPLVYLVSSYIL